MGYAFDVLALCLIMAWTLSILAGSLPPLKGEAKDRERERAFIERLSPESVEFGDGVKHGFARGQLSKCHSRSYSTPMSS